MSEQRTLDPKDKPVEKPAEKPVDPSARIHDDADPHVDEQLDKGLKETFPASDPVSINPGAD